MKFHPLDSSTVLPEKFTYPFCYTPHPACVAAAQQLIQHIRDDEKLRTAAEEGKMFGVLVVKNSEGAKGFLAAYSGTASCEFDNSYFVPSVYDYLQEDGFFKTGEREITEINRRIEEAENNTEVKSIALKITRMRERAEEEVSSFRCKMDDAKKRRNEKRNCGCSDAEEEAMKNESRFMKAELKRLKKRKEEEIAAASRQYDAIMQETEELRHLRRSKSDALQEKLFRHFVMLDKDGNKKDVYDIFVEQGAGIPPAGTGECCAPKMIQYAFAHGYELAAMAEFWYGKPSAAEIRHHLHYYPSCMGKCKPLLAYMLRGIDIDDNPMEHSAGGSLRIMYEDPYLCIADKPAGMPSVDGNINTRSAEKVVQAMRREAKIKAVHRLDMDTSGLLIFAKDDDTFAAMQKLFAERKVKKKYTAVLEGETDRKNGRISLPLSPDYINRPMQIADRQNGREAVTSYRVMSTGGGTTRISLTPITGRTHQLRVHCASSEGLAMPIVGDRLYGTPAQRLMLHASLISFVHPVTGQEITVKSTPVF